MNLKKIEARLEETEKLLDDINKKHLFVENFLDFTILTQFTQSFDLNSIKLFSFDFPFKNFDSEFSSDPNAHLDLNSEFKNLFLINSSSQNDVK